MEIVLNLAWLGVSLALVLLLGAHVMRAGDSHRRGIAAVALVCLVCFLFPVISMTDDLYSSGPAMLEPSKLKKLLSPAPVVLTLPPWFVLQEPQESSWAPLGLQPDLRRPAQKVFAFHLSRRPPPQPALTT